MFRSILTCVLAVLVSGTAFAQSFWTNSLHEINPVTGKAIRPTRSFDGRDTVIHKGRWTLKYHEVKPKSTPPAWLKNKLSAAQIDSLAMLGLSYDVDFDYFKQPDLTNADIENFMRCVKISLADTAALTRAEKEKRSSFHVPTKPATIKPFASPNASKDYPLSLTGTEFIVYSDADSYDAHVKLIITTVKKDHETGGFNAAFALQPYSVAGLKVDLENPVVMSTPARATAESICFNANGMSEEYYLFGDLTYTDTLGYTHKQRMMRPFRLQCPKK